MEIPLFDITNKEKRRLFQIEINIIFKTEIKIIIL